MRRLATLLLGTTSLIAFADAGIAADMAPRRMVTKAPVVAPVVASTWTGCYFGGHVGGAWGRKDVIDSEDAGQFRFDGFRDDIDGFFGGAQAGCDYQFDRNWVIGLEGQFSWSDIKGNFVRDPFFSTKGSGNGTFSVKTDWTSNLTGRIGYTSGPWMIYAKGGAAWAHDRYTLSGFSGQSTYFANGSETRAGYVVGVGVEYRLVHNVTAKAEYNYMDFGRELRRINGEFASGSLTVPISIDQQIHTFKIGLNYRFSTAMR